MTFEALVETVTLFTLAVLVVSWLADRFRLPAPLLLLAAGLLGSLLPFVHVPALDPELVLVGLLPPLLYAAAVNTPLIDFKNNLATIGWLSVGLVIFTTFGVALVVWWLLDVPFAAACALGAVVAPPDAVAATAVARRVGLPRQVVTVLEAESLVNDAAALVGLRTAIVALSATVTAGEVAAGFAWAVVSGVAVGVAMGRLAGWAFRLLPSGPMTTALSFLVPFFAYVPTEALHGSGVLAVVAAGLVLGYRSPREQDAVARVAQSVNWTTVSFVLENAVFLLIGLQAAQIVGAVAASGYSVAMIVTVCAVVLLTVIVLRMVWVMASHALWGRRNHSMGEGLVIGWAGMRGVVTLAGALSLPETMPARAVLILAALVVTVGTLLLQGLTLAPLARRLGLRGPDPREDAIEEATVMQRAVAAGLEEVERAATPADAAAVDGLRESSDRRLNAIWERLGRPSTEVETPTQTQRRLRLIALAEEREVILGLRDEGRSDQSVLAHLLASLDLEETFLTRLAHKADATTAVPLAIRIPASGCEHLESAPACVKPATTGGCPDCEAEGLTPVHLRLCLRCGNIGCCDSSVGRHASRHHETTGHPVMRSFEPGEAWRWCFVDKIVSD